MRCAHSRQSVVSSIVEESSRWGLGNPFNPSGCPDFPREVEPCYDK